MISWSNVAWLLVDLIILDLSYVLSRVWMWKARKSNLSVVALVVQHEKRVVIKSALLSKKLN